MISNKLLFLFFGSHIALNLDKAIDRGMFRRVTDNSMPMNLEFNPAKSHSAAYNLYYDYANHYEEEEERDTKLFTEKVHGNNRIITFSLDPNWSASIDNNDFSVGLSIVFLKFESWVNSSSIEVNIHKVFYDSWAESRNETIFPNIHLPTENNETFFHPSSIIKSFSSEDPMQYIESLSAEITLKDWDVRNQLYFTLTSYKIGRRSPSVRRCEGYSYNKHWWNCMAGDDPLILCINFDLTCNYLPNCASRNIPNPDENCTTNEGMQEALKLIIYCLLAVFAVMLFAGCAKCCFRGLCPGRFRRNYDRRPSDVADIVIAEETNRPDGAPPTYDDAMKFVNDAFENNEDEEPPPSYSATPKNGEEVWNSYSSNTSQQRSDQNSEIIQVQSSADSNILRNNNCDILNLPRSPPPYSNVQ